MLRLPSALKSLEYIACLHYADSVTDLIHLNQSLHSSHNVAGLMLLTGSLTNSTGSDIRCLGLGRFSTFHKMFVDASRQDYLSLVNIGLQYESPFSWQNARRNHSNSVAWNMFDSALQEAGLRSGFSMCTQLNQTNGEYLCAHIASENDQMDDEQEAMFEYIIPYLTRTAAKHWLFSDNLLSNKQQEIIQCAQSGLDNSKIARQLGIPNRAVRFHLRKICEIAGTDSVDEAISVFGQLSLHRGEP